eukprot:TRINITY_DN16555_c0_g1_i1.p1 TRINITY_DN16555_c0_g1~~TRINITY_DN16555_c0_g1_i1.p1  ORF type:complete len:191 (+),score=26.75 TRINITY_DN16555_c0_g1_i1:64-573(+)
MAADTSPLVEETTLQIRSPFRDLQRLAATRRASSRKRSRTEDGCARDDADAAEEDANTPAEDDGSSRNLPLSPTGAQAALRRLRDAISFSHEDELQLSQTAARSPKGALKRPRVASEGDVNILLISQVRHVGHPAGMDVELRASSAPHSEAAGEALPLGADEEWQCGED